MKSKCDTGQETAWPPTSLRAKTSSQPIFLASKGDPALLSRQNLPSLYGLLFDIGGLLHTCFKATNAMLRGDKMRYQVMGINDSSNHKAHFNECYSIDCIIRKKMGKWALEI